jgi:hypothetical protein
MSLRRSWRTSSNPAACVANRLWPTDAMRLAERGF